MNALIKLIKNDHIKLATGSGLCIIILALFFKKGLHIPVPHLESSLPGFVFCVYEALKQKKKLTNRFWLKPWFWNSLMFLVTGLIILRRLLLMD
ncbi:hypothetical protein ACFLQW_00310 [Candidatus Zixiibacteriota bacterium]